MEDTEISWILLEILKVFFVLMGAFGLKKFIIPLKRGIKYENQKLINEGVKYIIISVVGFVMFFYIMVINR